LTGKAGFGLSDHFVDLDRQTQAQIDETAPPGPNPTPTQPPLTFAAGAAT